MPKCPNASTYVPRAIAASVLRSEDSVFRGLARLSAVEVFASLGIGLLIAFCWNPFQQRKPASFVSIQPETLNFDLAGGMEYHSQDLEIVNNGIGELRFVMRFACDCIYAEPTSGKLLPKQTTRVRVSYRSVKFDRTSSVRIENQNISIELSDELTNDRIDVPVLSKVARPVIVDPLGTNVEVDALAVSNMKLDFVVCDDVERLEVLSSPDFVRNVTVGSIGEFQTCAVRGEIGPIDNAQSGSIKIRAWLSKGKGPIDTTVPFAIKPSCPFRLSTSMVSLKQGSRGVVAIVPLVDAINISIDKMTFDKSKLRASFEGNQILLVALDPKEFTDWVELTVVSSNSDGVTAKFEKGFVVQHDLNPANPILWELETDTDSASDRDDSTLNCH